MVVECFAVIIIVIAIALIYLRAHRPAYVIAIAPIGFVPVANLLAVALADKATKILPFTRIEIHMGINILAAIIACVCFGMFSIKFNHKGNRTAYLFTCVTFTVIFTGVLLNNLIA